ncbi:MAG: serine/threonine protein kinase [Bacteroidales bacterium]|nr:serine/threonine protein kinase [Bacteroidales bacterium]
MNSDDTSSTSGQAIPLEFNITDTFSYHQELSSKGYCRVFKAQRYGKWYVLKGLQPQYTSNPLYLAMIEKEFSNAVVLDHPNIVHTYSICDDAVVGKCFVMEYVEGRTLAQYLKEKPSVPARRKVIAQLLDAMDYYHKKQIIHRDLKPSNILITNNGDNVKIIDFGLSDTDDYAMLKEPAYTEGYAAPEQMVSGAPIDCRTDIYAFGILLQQIFPDRYRHIARRCTQHDPQQRYASATAVGAAIRQNDIIKRIMICIMAFVVLMAIATALLTSAVYKKQNDVVVEESTNNIGHDDSTTNEVTNTITASTPAELQAGNDHKAVEALHVDEAAAELKHYADSIYALLCADIDNGLYTTDNAAYQRVSTMFTYISDMEFRLYIKYKPTSEKKWREYSDALHPIVGATQSDMLKYVDEANLPRLISSDSAMVKEYRQAESEFKKAQNIWFETIDEYNREVLDNITN